ncbi:MAG: AsmA family protein, partial [Cytophagales bacterium]
MKKFLIILAGVFALVMVLLFTLPMLFKKQIKEKLESEINKQIEAKVFFDEGKFSLSLIRNFPNLSVSLGDFGVVGINDFNGDTLASIGSFNLTVDIMSVIKGDQIKVLGLRLEKPRIKAKVNKEGKANWDIAKKDTSAVDEKPKEDEEPSSFSLKVKKWEISKGYVSFDDYSSNTHAEIVNLNHSGKGDITNSIFDLVTKTTIDAISAKVGNSTYLNKAKIDFDVAINIDNEKSKYTFKENTFKINEFALHVDGFYSMPDTAYSEMDLKFSAPQTSFKSLLSLIPAVFLSEFDKIKTEGEFSFSGFAKGKQSATELPQFGLQLNVEKAMFKYPDLPTPVSNIGIDLFVENKDVIDNLYVNLKKFHMDLGSNPIDATLELKGLSKMDLNANVMAKLNLDELTKVFPIEGTELKGFFGLDAKAKGIYEAATNTMPAVSANMNLTKGFAKSKDFPSAIENIEMTGSAMNPSGQMKDMKIDITKFAFQMDQQPFDLKLHLEDLENYKWDFSAKGIIDLGKIFKIFPIEGTTMNGIVTVNDFNTKGVYSDVTAGRFDKFPTSGNMNFKNFEYFERDLLPQGFKMTTGNLNFDPQKLKIEGLKGFLGASDIAIDGYIANYIPFVFSDGVVKGEMKFVSNQFDVNEFIPKPDPNAPKPEPVAEEIPSNVEAVEVPKAFDFVLSSDIKRVLYDNLTIDNLLGDIIIKDGALRLRGVNFNLLEGFFKTN